MRLGERTGKGGSRRHVHDTSMLATSSSRKLIVLLKTGRRITARDKALHLRQKIIQRSERSSHSRHITKHRSQRVNTYHVQRISSGDRMRVCSSQRLQKIIEKRSVRYLRPLHTISRYIRGLFPRRGLPRGRADRNSDIAS